MKFVLDQDVDARVRTFLIGEGHECWTADDAAMAEAGDDSITVYAMKKRAAVITHDRSFSRRRRKNSIGQHVHLRCLEPDAIEVLGRHLQEVLHYLAAAEDVYVKVTRTQVTASFDWK